jgi:two-component system, cell cycle response regulator
MDGLALCRNLRLRTGDGYIYVMMLTVRDGRSDVVAGLAAGADDYVVKGAAPAEIVARIDVGRRITALERSLRKSSLENRRMAVTDPLTGSRNRRFLMKYLPRELARARDCSQPIAILSCDIDHFKRINDDFGHEVGDEVLQSFVDRAGHDLRQSVDWIARAGGEEFVIVLPNTTLRSASHVASRLCATLNNVPIATTAGPLAITVSIGVTALESTEDLKTVSESELLRTADRLLYTSKLLGRNRVTVAAVHKTSLISHAQH